MILSILISNNISQLHIDVCAQDKKEGEWNA